MTISAKHLNEVGDAGRTILSTFELHLAILRRQLGLFKDGTLSSDEFLIALERLGEMPLASLTTPLLTLSTQATTFRLTSAKNAREFKRRAREGDPLGYAPHRRHAEQTRPLPKFAPSADLLNPPEPTPEDITLAMAARLAEMTATARVLLGLGLDPNDELRLRGFEWTGDEVRMLPRVDNSETEWGSDPEEYTP